MNRRLEIKSKRTAGGKPVVLLDFGDWRLTLREAVFSAFIAGILTAVGFFISGAIERHVHERHVQADRPDRQEPGRVQMGA